MCIRDRIAALLATTPALAEMSAEELAKFAQNPVGNLLSLPFQNNTNLNFGPKEGTQNILNIQPVIPVSYTHLDVYKRQQIQWLRNWFTFPRVTRPRAGCCARTPVVIP